MKETRSQAAERELVKMAKNFEDGKSRSDKERSKLIAHPRFQKLSNIIYPNLK